MSTRKKDFLVHLVLGAVVATAICALNLSRGYPVFRCLCDGCFVAAVLLLGIGGIAAVRNQGVFDVVGYGVKYTVELVVPMLRRNEKEDIHEYRERKAKERKDSSGMMLAGVVYLVLSFLLLIPYMLIDH